MGNHSVLNDMAIDITNTDTWHSLEVAGLPDGIAIHNIQLSELLHKSERLDLILPITDVLKPTGLLNETLNLIKPHSSKIGVWADTSVSTEDLDELIKLTTSNALLQSLQLIIFYMPSFVDGRSFSQAKNLRLNGFKGEIRIAGDFGPDQIPYLLRSGFDSFVITNELLDSDLDTAFNALSTAYDGTDASKLPMFR